MPHRLRLVGPFVAALAGACGSAPQVHQELVARREALIAAMREAAQLPAPKPPRLYVDSGVWWILRFGEVVAIDGAIVAVRLRPTENAWDWEPDDFAVAGISDESHRDGLKGDCVLVAHFDGFALCRYFDSPFDLNPDPPHIGDSAAFHPGITDRLAEEIAGGTAEWIPAAAPR